MLGSDSQVRLVDFGSARWAEEPIAPAGIRGSPYWLAPECVREPMYDVFKADIWSFGALLIELLDSTPPFY